MESVYILSNIKGKYFYKSIRLIIFKVIHPIFFIAILFLVVFILLFIFQNEKTIKFLEIINL